MTQPNLVNFWTNLGYILILTTLATGPSLLIYLLKIRSQQQKQALDRIEESLENSESFYERVQELREQLDDAIDCLDEVIVNSSKFFQLSDSKFFVLEESKFFA